MDLDVFSKTTAVDISEGLRVTKRFQQWIGLNRKNIECNDKNHKK